MKKLLLALLLIANSSWAVIAFDAATSTNGTASSFTFSHTVGTGQDRILIVSVAFNSSTGSVSSVTYNSISMTKAISRQGAAAVLRTEIWYLLNPSTGANNVIATLSASTRTIIGSASYTGVSDIGATAGNDGTGATLNVSLLTTQSASYIVGMAATRGNTASVTNPSNVTARWTNTVGSGANTITGNGNDLTCTATNTYSTTWTMAGNNDCAVQTELKEAISPPQGSMGMMGVGH
jgi:hypothetical protein